jgi:hypothetical protein
MTEILARRSSPISSAKQRGLVAAMIGANRN